MAAGSSRIAFPPKTSTRRAGEPLHSRRRHRGCAGRGFGCVPAVGTAAGDHRREHLRRPLRDGCEREHPQDQQGVRTHYRYQARRGSRKEHERPRGKRGYRPFREPRGAGEADARDDHAGAAGRQEGAGHRQPGHRRRQQGGSARRHQCPGHHGTDGTQGQAARAYAGSQHVSCGAGQDQAAPATEVAVRHGQPQDEGDPRAGGQGGPVRFEYPHHRANRARAKGLSRSPSTEPAPDATSLSLSSTARRFPRTSSRANSSATSRAPFPGQAPRARKGFWSWRTRARYFSTRSGT